MNSSLLTGLKALSLLLLLVSNSLADDWSCTSELGGHKYDFTPLGGEHTLTRERETPPTKMVDTLTFNLCKPLSDSADSDPDKACLVPLPLTRKRGRILISRAFPPFASYDIVQVWDLCMPQDHE